MALKNINIMTDLKWKVPMVFGSFKQKISRVSLTETHLSFLECSIVFLTI